MGAVISKFIDLGAWLFTTIILPTARLVFYLTIICLFIALVVNLAGILGAILFFVVFYYYVVGVIFVPPTDTMVMPLNPTIPTASIS
jgi:hypothetical protein